MKLITLFALLAMILSSLWMKGQLPNVTVRFSNPEYVCSNQKFSVDVEFQCDQANKQLYSMNVRFYYPCDVVAFDSLGEFVPGYGLMNGAQPVVNVCDSATGVNYFSLPGSAVWVNGAIKKIGITSLKLSTTDWTKIFNMNFHVIDTNAFNVDSFCSSLIWDLKQDLSGGFTPNSSGVVIALTNSNTYEHVVQYNWQYDTIPGEPFGFPVETTCLSTICGFAPKSVLPTYSFPGFEQVDIPVKVVDFDSIGAFSLAFTYDSTVLEYVGDTANPVFNDTNGYVTVTNVADTGAFHRIVMVYDGLPVTLADSASLVIFTFNPLSGSTPLTWITADNVCQYYNSSDYPLWDSPDAQYYFNGGVTTPEAVAPVARIDSITTMQGNLVTFPVKVWDYSCIASGSLMIDFDPAVLSFYQSLPNATLAAGFTSQVVSPGRLQISWSGSSTSLDDGSALVYLVFSFLGGVSSLEWYDTGTTCHYVSGMTNGVLEDEPTCQFYINGSIAPAEFIWTGVLSNDWDTDGNWEYNMIPDQFTDVVISTVGARSNYPVYDGDFTLGAQCRNLRLIGDAQFAVTGGLTIGPGNILEITDDGILHIGGDWTNSGIFHPGNGMVDFMGTGDAAIKAGVPPQNYVSGYILTEYAKGMTVLTGSLAGPAGDDSHSDVSLGFTFTYLGVDYTQVRINTNGWLSFNLSGDDSTSCDNVMLFDICLPSTVVAPWWDNLLADTTSAVSYKTEGTAPDRVFTAEWKHVLAYSTGSSARLNFQVKLYEGTNAIEFCYGDLETGTHNFQEGASIGIKDATGGMGNFLEATHNSTSLILPCIPSATDWPDVNYRFTPPVPGAMDTFYKLLVTKSGGEVSVQRDVRVTGVE
jgi:hypothetical protein